jgi:ABC-2 type transport system permease protein
MADLPPATRTVRLVATREFTSRARSYRVVVGTVSVGLLLVAFLLLQAFMSHQQPTVRIGLAGQAIGLQEGLPQEMTALGVPVTVRQVDSLAQGVEQVRDGRLDVLVHGSRSALRVTVAGDLDPRLRATLNSQVRQQILAAQIAQLGARPDQVLAKVGQASITVTRLRVTDPDAGRHTTLGVVTALLVGWSLFAAAGLAARRIAQDKVCGIAEALLPVLRPRRLLTGNLGGVGLTGLVHAAALGVVGVVVALGTGVVAGPGAVLVAFGTGLLGFVLGFGMYGTVAALLAAVLVPASGDRMPPVGRAPLVGLGIAVVTVLSAILVGVAPAGSATGVLSVLPPFAPVLTPARLASGAAEGWQVLLAVLLTLATIGGLAWLAGRVYPSSLLRG